MESKEGRESECEKTIQKITAAEKIKKKKKCANDIKKKKCYRLKRFVEKMLILFVLKLKSFVLFCF